MTPVSVTPARRIKSSAAVIATICGVLVLLYIWVSDVVLERLAAGRPELLIIGSLGKGTVFAVVSAVALFVLVWRFGLRVWQRAQTDVVAAQERERAHWQALFEHGPEGALLLEDGAILAANLAAAEMLCRPIAVLEGLPLRQIVASATDSPSPSELAEVRAGEVVHHTWCLTRSGSPPFDADVSLTRLPGDHGEGRILAWLRDLTEERERADELEDVNDRLRVLVEGSPSFFFYIQDLDGDVTYVSPSVEAITGRSPAAWLGQKHWYTTDSPVNRAAREATRRNLAGDFAPNPVQVEIRHVDGRPVTLEVYEYGRFVEGVQVGLHGIAHDVTARVRAERVQQATYRISEAASSASSLDELYPAIHRIVGELMPAENLYFALYDPAKELISFPYWVDAQDPRPQPEPPGRGLTALVLRTGEPVLASPEVFAGLVSRGEVEALGAPSVDWLGVPLKQGSRTFGVLAVQSYSEGVRFGEPEKALLQYVSTQVAMAILRTQTEHALRDSEQRLRDIVEHSSNLFYSHTADHQLTYISPQSREFFGCEPDQALTRWFEFLTDHPVNRRGIESTERAIATGERQPVYELELEGRQGRRLWVEVNEAPVVRDGRTVAIVGALTDITDRKQAEEQLRHAQKMEAIGRLAGGVAHDINNLLQALLSAVQGLVARGDQDDHVAAVAGELESHVRRGAALTRQLLLFAKREVVKHERFDLNRVVEATSAMLRRLVRENIRIVHELHPGPVVVDGDRTQLEQVLVNLVVNASDAMPGGGTLTIRTEKPTAEEVQLEVEDSGVGMGPEVLERIFEPFFTTKAGEQGTGLGLAVVHGIVAQHGGDVDVRSRFGEGTRVRVRLPAQDADSAVPTEETLSPDGVPRGAGERVLLVEDEEATRAGLAEILQLLGYEVVSADSGETAWAVAGDQEFQVLLSDVMLPGISGARLAERLRERWPDVRVILMSGYTEDQVVRDGVSRGKLRFLQKPFTMSVLAREVRAALDGNPE